ncbi:MAG TPA: 2-phospho-L-lactate guanylyltransferase [Acidimicrobiia bacterium]|nr:2-phospho-L-lactate guanylyltransferase [Acidimicrobiia bacterium]
MTSSHDVTVMVVPIRDFAGMTRLSSVLTSEARSALAVELAHRVVRAGVEAGLDVRVVTGDPAVETWCEHIGVTVVDDPGTGLNGAANAGVARAGEGAWIVVHADLPFVTSEALSEVAHTVRHRDVLVPSADGGTNIVGGRGSFPFSFGPGSFTRHFASCPEAEVAPSRALSVDIDTAFHLAAYLAIEPASTLST